MRLSVRLWCLVLLACGFPAESHAQGIRWSRAINGPGNAAAYVGDGRFITRSLGADRAGNVIVTGSTSDGVSTNFLTTKLLAQTGGIAWQKVFAGAAGRDDDPGSVAVDAAGNAIVVGLSIGASTSDIQVIKYAAADGAVLWSRTLDAGVNEAGYFIAVDAAGNAFAGGEAFNGANWDVRIVKLAAANGATLWDQTFNSQRDDFISDLQVDGDGNAIVLGASVNAAFNYDIRVAKYSAAGGALLWQRTIDGGGEDEAYNLALDGAGNVLLAGYSSAAGNSNFVTAKLSGASGAVLWQKSYDGGRVDAAQSVAADAAGNVFVTGQSQSAGRFVFKTLKYSGATGALLWEKSFDGGVNAYAYQLVLDSAGNAIVSGSNTVGAQLDWKTVAYASADGALLFESSYAGSAGDNDEIVASIAVPGGVVIAGSVREAGLATGVRVVKISTGAVPAAVTDFDGDGRSDILYRNAADGRVSRLLMNGLAISGAAVVYSEPNTAWKIVADGDFNGDGIADLLFRNDATGQLSAVLFGAGGVPVNAVPFFTEANPAWKVIAAPDLDGDGKADILWWNSQTGQVFAMLMNGAAIVASGQVHVEADTAWRIVAVGDFAASGRRNQLLWRHARTGQVYLMTIGVSNGTFTQSGQVFYTEPDAAWKIVAAADLNGDGRSDILWRHAATGEVYVMPMDGATVLAGALVYREPDPAWQVVATGDYNGDGRADILWRHSATGQVYMMLMNGLSIAAAGLVYAEPDTVWKVLGPGGYSQ